jgi:uncharacterized repeat protein (TIGR03803 family)
MKATPFAMFACAATLALDAGAASKPNPLIFAFSNTVQGNSPQGTVIGDGAGNLYGTTVFGGQYGLGTVYRLSPPAGGATAWTETVLHSFSGTGDGAAPESAGPATGPDGMIYGTTFYASGQGGGWVYTPIYGFLASKNDSRHPIGQLAFDRAGNLYGTTLGQRLVPGGSVFRLAPPASGPAWTQTRLYRCTNTGNGGAPRYGVWLDQASTVFGTMSYGGAYGAVFRQAP